MERENKPLIDKIRMYDDKQKNKRNSTTKISTLRAKSDVSSDVSISVRAEIRKDSIDS